MVTVNITGHIAEENDGFESATQQKTHDGDVMHAHYVTCIQDRMRIRNPVCLLTQVLIDQILVCV